MNELENGELCWVRSIIHPLGSYSLTLMKQPTTVAMLVM